MPQRKTEAVLVSLEPGLKEILERSISKSQMSASAYFRRLAIQNLKDEGLLTDEILFRITEG